MNKEKLIRYEIYLLHLTNKMTSLTPKKHQKHPETYKQFLSREISDVNKKIAALKLEGVDKK